ncbi:hypothetical protein Vi05172_g8290 [Venturia inaequalis]|nr:hypothetical protein Vi05172_g8290 [Venturia inaequalis]
MPQQQQYMQPREWLGEHDMEKLKQGLDPKQRGSEEQGTGPIDATNWTTFRHWALCFIVCNFNVDVGPEIELLYPEDTPLSTADLSAICFNSFPERQDSDTTDDVTFHFNIRNHSPDISLSSPNRPYGSADTLYGTVCFRQEYDSTTKRRFNQKSLVCLSNHDFPAFFAKLLHISTENGFISDPLKLQVACSEMSSWPAPTVGSQELHFLGYLLGLEIPPHKAYPFQGLSSPASTGQYAYEPLGSWDCLLPHLASLTELYVVFEKLFLCESVIVLAKSPQLCSQLVSCLVDLLPPVPYAGTCKPYITMQSEFFAREKELPKHFLVGVTNPFLLKRLVTAAHSNGVIPHVVYLTDSPGPVPLKHQKSHRGHRQSGEHDIPGGIEAQEPTKRFLKSDDSFLDMLDLTLRNPDVTKAPIGPLVRRYFGELAGQILAPLNRFLASQMAVSPFSPGGNPHYANFSEANFLSSLAKHGTTVKFRGQGPLQRHKMRDSFYSRFCQSANFYSWIEMKTTLEREANAGMLGGKS